MKKNELERILKQHPYKITFSAGRWQTFVKDDTQKSGRKKLAKSTEGKLNIALYDIFSLGNNPLSEAAISNLYKKYINTIREMAGHADERTTYNSYCFDRHTEQEKRMQIEQALA